MQRVISSVPARLQLLRLRDARVGVQREDGDAEGLRIYRGLQRLDARVGDPILVQRESVELGEALVVCCLGDRFAARVADPIVVEV